MWRGSTAAHLAARQGRLETLELLYERGADVNAQDAWNYATPLIVAAEGGHASTVAFLLAKRVRAEARDKFGTDAAQCAGTAETKNLIRRHTTLRRVRLLLRGADASDCFLGWRDARLDAKATRQRESKGTWQMVFALFGESALARYYWLWRQWHSGNARARRAVGERRRRGSSTRSRRTPGSRGSRGPGSPRSRRKRCEEKKKEQKEEAKAAKAVRRHDGAPTPTSPAPPTASAPPSTRIIPAFASCLAARRSGRRVRRTTVGVTRFSPVAQTCS